jgi:predicted transcriptional regulator
MKTKPITLADFNTPALNARYKRSKAVARALDEKLDVLPYSVREFQVTEFESFLRHMSAKRLQLLKMLPKRGLSVSDLAFKMERDPSAIRKDIAALGALGLVQTVSVLNAGHGVKKMIYPAAERIEIRGSFEALDAA